MNAEDLITYSMPTVPEPDPCDYRVSSAPCLIQTAGGQFYTAQWIVYNTARRENEFEPAWELCGREGLQLDREEVVAWQSIVRYVEGA